MRRELYREQSAVSRNAVPDGLLASLDQRLPFELTEGQRSVSDVIMYELSDEHPMHRLLQGEVGSGKTVVALRAMLAVVDAGGQAGPPSAHGSVGRSTCALDPHPPRTSAEQGLLGGSEHSTTVTLLTGSQSTAVRRQALLEIASGQAGIVIGTHALLEDKVTFADLGLVVIDEQHRFGVEQRAALTAKAGAGTRPHVLVMTATRFLERWRSRYLVTSMSQFHGVARGSGGYHHPCCPRG